MTYPRPQMGTEHGVPSLDMWPNGMASEMKNDFYTEENLLRRAELGPRQMRTTRLECPL